ncbi:MAG: hypothetical protein IJ002_08480 [Clostridia bacterium]|nr:hypothetical protein [Clostridia bacterium]
MNAVVIGIGAYGISVIEAYEREVKSSKVIAVDTNKTLLNTVSIENKIQLSKRLSETDTVERIKGKLKKSVKDSDIVFIVTNPLDLPKPNVIPRIAEFLKSLNILVLGIVLKPFGKIDRKRKKEINTTIDWILYTIATVVIPQKVVPQYQEPNNQFCQWSVSNGYLIDEYVFEQVEFYRWYQKSCLFNADICKETLVGVFFLNRILDMLHEEYFNATWNDICRVISLPGVVHMASAISLKENGLDTLRYRASFNNLLNTSLHGAKALLFVLKVPLCMEKNEVGRICNVIHSFTDESVDSYFTIEVMQPDSDTISAKVIAIVEYDIAIQK